MSVGNNLQEMENVVTKNASPGDPMQKGPSGAKTPGNTAQIEDLGGPTPENYKTDDNSAKLNTPGKTLKQVRDVVNAKATPGDQAMPTMKKEEEEKPEDQVVSEEETTEEEIVAEEETSENEVVSEEETIENEVVAEEEALIAELNIEEDVAALFAGEELSEEFQEKAKTIFETTIKSKVSQITEELKNEFEQSLTEEIASIKEEIEDRADAYLEYVADEWLAENALSVEQGLKTEMTDSFLTGMKSLFEDHYVSIPEEKYDVLNSMVDKLDEMEGKLNEQIERNVALNRRLAESTADVIFADVTEGLADTQKEKLATLAENVEFESESDYREKLGTLKESYFPTKGTSAPKSTSENLSEEVSTDEVASQEVNPTMQAYLGMLSRAAKK